MPAISFSGEPIEKKLTEKMEWKTDFDIMQCLSSPHFEVHALLTRLN